MTLGKNRSNGKVLETQTAKYSSNFSNTQPLPIDHAGIIEDKPQSDGACKL
jgi:hypothetical protein